MNLLINICRFEAVKLICFMLFFAIVANVSCQPTEEAIMEETVSNSVFDSSPLNEQHPITQSNNGVIGGRVKREVSCYAGRAGCISSCQWQNCGTGFCRGGWGGTCVCSRCENGN